MVYYSDFIFLILIKNYIPTVWAKPERKRNKFGFSISGPQTFNQWLSFRPKFDNLS